MVTTLMVLAFVVGLLVGRFTHGRMSERGQRERLRQVANGGRADMPSWALIRERQRQRLHRRVH
jgi:hypothetical protein